MDSEGGPAARDTNPETEALGIDPAAFVGLDAAAIRRLVGGEECALVIATEGAPPGWPAEIVETGVDAGGGGFALEWRYQDARGEWRSHYAYLRPEPVTAWDWIPAYVYTRRPLRTPATRIRPIIEVAFDRDGTCRRASAAIAEFILRNRIQFANLFPAQEFPVAAEPVPAPHPGETDVAADLTAALGLPAPSEQIAVHGATCREGAAGLSRWLWNPEGRVLVYVDAASFQRITVFCAPGEVPTVATIEDHGIGSPMALPSGGLRILLHDADGTPRVRFDAWGSPLGLAVNDGKLRHLPVSVLLAGRPLTPVGLPGGTVTSITLLARGTAPVTEPRLVHEPATQRLRIRGVPPVSLKLLRSQSWDDPPAYAATGLRWD